ncbi:MAG TPA: type II secretion system protein GspM [Stellaceae bacterium]|nr:type II secretion system protein GspM [Stellaceae bacterium]
MPPLARRGLALAILLVLVGAVYAVAVQPLIDDYRDTTQSIEQMSALLQRYQRVAANLAPLQAQLASVQQRQGAKDGFFAGANDTLVAAQLQGKLRTAVEAARGELKSTQVLPTEDDGKMRRITVRGQMASTLGAVQRVIYEIEASSPYLFVDNLNLRVRAAERRAEVPDQDPILDVRFDVYGYLSSAK